MRGAPPLPDRPATRPPRPRHALLVNPFYRKDPVGSFVKHALVPSLALTSVAAATPADWTVAFHDENLLRGTLASDPPPAVAGITVHITSSRRAYELSAWFRRRGSIVVLGGPHVTAMPGDAAPHADVLAIGNGVRTWPRILRDAAAGVPKKVYRGDDRLPFREEPAPRREILPSESFLTTASVIAGRGCHNRCDFCYLATEGLRTPFEVRDPADVVAEIRSLGSRYVVFLDNNLGSRPAYLRDLCRALVPLRIIWSAAVSLDVMRDPALFGEMARSGCTGVFLGLETVNGENLVDARKSSPSPEEYGRFVRRFQDEGIGVNGSFVFGFDHDRADVFDRTVAWIEEHRLRCATFQILTPYPGTPLFRRLDAEGRILTRDWSRYDTCHAVFRPRHLAPLELEQGYAGIYRRVFTPASIWRRRPDDPGEVPAYLAMAYLYKKANRLWRALIGRGLVRAAWTPLVAASHLRHRARRIADRTAALHRAEMAGRLHAGYDPADVDQGGEEWLGAGSRSR